jgi:hypothetical protein
MLRYIIKIQGEMENKIRRAVPLFPLFIMLQVIK